MPKLIVVGHTGGEVHVPFYESPAPGRTVVVPSMKLEVGGSAVNTAINAARIGISTAVAGVLGDDTIGFLIRTKLQSANVDVTRLNLLEGETSPMALVETNAEGSRAFVDSPGTNARFDVPSVLPRVPCQICHLASPERLRDAWPEKILKIAARLQEAGMVLTLDTFVSERRRRETKRQITEHHELLELVDVVFMDEAEAILISGREEEGAVFNYFHHLGVKVCVIKRGKRGALVSWSGGIDAVDAVDAKVVDTIGVGDAFAAGFLAGSIRGFEPPACASMGSIVAGLCLSAAGPLEGTMDRDRLRKALRRFETVPEKA